MDIQSAFADGPFGSGVKSESDKPEPVETETTTEQRDAGGETPEPVKADSDAGARDERDDGDDEAKIDGPPGSEGLQKALKSERSLRREQRKGLSEALKAKEQFEAQSRQQAAEIAALRQQIATSVQQQQVPQKKEEEPGFFELGPEEYTRRVAEAQAKKMAEQFVPQIERMRSQHLDQAEELYVKAVPDGRAAIDRFAQVAKQDPRVLAEYRAVVAGTHPLAMQNPLYRNPVQFAAEMGRSALTVDEISKAGNLEEWKKAERAKWEAERAQSGEQAVNGRREATGWSAPKTLAGRRGGGSSVTPASAGDLSIDQAFRF